MSARASDHTIAVWSVLTRSRRLQSAPPGSAPVWNGPDVDHALDGRRGALVTGPAAARSPGGEKRGQVHFPAPRRVLR